MTQIADNEDEAAALRAHLGDEIYEIFVEEIHEIYENLQEWLPAWLETGEKETLRDIRRGYHTLKGSGRMAGALALGDYAWAHESMLNAVLDSKLKANDGLVVLLKRSLSYLGERLHFFLIATETDESVRTEVARVEAYMADPDTPIVIKPEVAEPEVAEPEVAEPEIAEPEIAEPEIAEPEVAEPEVAEPEMAASNFTSDQDSLNNPENRAIWDMLSEELVEQLQAIDALMLSLQSKPDDAGAWQSLKRELHTIKGGTRMAGLMSMGDLAHQAETTLEDFDPVKQPELVTRKLQTVQQYVDEISQLSEQYATRVYSPDIPEEVLSESVTETAEEPDEFIAFQQDEDTAEPDSMLERLLLQQAKQLPDIAVLAANKQAATATDTNTEPLDSALSANGQEHIRLPATFLDRMIEKAASLNVQQSGIGERLQAMNDDVREFGRTATRLRQLLRSLELETEAQIHAGYRLSTPQSSGKFDPLEMDEYSELQRLSRSLAESLNDLVNIEADLSQQLRNVGGILTETQSGSRNLYQELLVTRLIEVSAIVPRLRRVVRQAAADTERDVELSIKGDSLKLDRHLLQKMTSPIEHLLRNAISHGIESKAERLKAGKPAQGTIQFEVSREDGEIVIRVSDDGRGLDSGKLRNKAVDLGLIRDGDVLPEQDVQRLILRSGFTTAAAVSQLSGRGVGMDVVNSDVKAMGGVLQIKSVAQQGTTFTMRLPLAMTANPVLFVTVQSQFYAMQLGNIQGLMRLSTEEVQTHLGMADQPLRFNDMDFPLHYLGAVLEPGLQLQLQADHMYPVVFVRTGDQCIAWLVDSISGRREVLLQSLGALFKSCRFYSAATITTDGQVVLVPDMVELASRVQEATKAPELPEAQLDSDMRAERPLHERMHVLVVDDSITVRKVTEKLLAGENYEVGTARDGLDALQKLDEFEPDLVLSDIEMPRMDGFELLSAVRQSELWSDVPVIMISSRTAGKHRERATDLGASDFLGKPYQNDELLTLIKRHLAARQEHEAEVVA